VIDSYTGDRARVPMDVIALTDHQRAVDTTVYPRTEWTDLDLVPDGSSYENRDPSDLGVIAVEGLEVEGNDNEFDQMGGFDAPDLVRSSGSERDVFESIDESGGWGWFLHPGKYYDDPETAWKRGYYPEFLEEIPARIGLEVINRANRHPTDERFWDVALADLAPQTRLLGVAADDFHRPDREGHQYPVSWNTMLLPAEEFDPGDQPGTRRAMRSALTDGATLFSHVTPEDPDAMPPAVRALHVDGRAAEATVETTHYDSVEWISDGEVVARDETIDLTDGAVGSYLRLELTEEAEGATWTQPLLLGA